MALLKQIIIGLLLLHLVGCCLPILGPCGQDLQIFYGASAQSGVVIHSLQLPESFPTNEPFGVAYVSRIDSQFAGHPPTIVSGATSTVIIPQGKYRFEVVPFWAKHPSTTKPMPVACHDTLKPGHYALRAVRTFNEKGMMFYTAIVQEISTKKVVCVTSPGKATDVPKWAKDLL